MSIKKIREKIIEYIFYIGFFLYVIYQWLDVTVIGDAMQINIILQIALLCIIIKLILTQYRWWEYMTILIILLCFYASYKTSGKMDYFINVLLLFSSKNIDIKKVLKLFLCTIIVMIGFLMAKILIGNMPYIVDIRDYGRGLVEARFRFAWRHANTAHCVYFLVVGTFLTIFYKKVPWYGFLVFISLNYFLYELTISRTGFISTLVLIALFFFLRYGKKFVNDRIVFVFLESINVICIVGTVYSVFIAKYTENIVKLNQLTTGRIIIARQMYEQCGIHIFGGNLNYKVPDLGVARTLLQFGPIIFCLFYFGILLSVWKLYCKQKYELAVWITVLTVYYTFESYLMAAFDPRPILMGAALYMKCPKFGKHYKKSRIAKCLL